MNYTKWQPRVLWKYGLSSEITIQKLFRVVQAIPVFQYLTTQAEREFSILGAPKLPEGID